MPTKEILKSIKGRQLGLDSDGGLVGREPLESLSTATSAVASLRGTTLLSSAAGTYTLGPPPEVGIVKRIATTTTSTLVRSVTRVSTAFYFKSSEGTTMVTIAMAGQAASVTLQSISASAWQVMARTSTDTTLSGTS